MKNLNLSEFIHRLSLLERLDIDGCDNGEFIQNVERIEPEDGQYIRSEDLDKLITEFRHLLQ